MAGWLPGSRRSRHVFQVYPACMFVLLARFGSHVGCVWVFLARWFVFGCFLDALLSYQAFCTFSLSDHSIMLHYGSAPIRAVVMIMLIPGSDHRRTRFLHG